MKRLWNILLLLVAALLFTGCTVEKNSVEETGKDISIYYLSKDDSKVVPVQYHLEETDTKDALAVVMSLLMTQPDRVDLKAPVSGTFQVLDYKVEEAVVLVNMDAHYKEMDPIREILTRAALVRTITQIPGIDYVSLKIDGEDLTDGEGNLVGTMNADLFIDNAGKEINAYEKVKLHLYFANKAGDGLVEVNQTLVYNSNISLEKLVVEQVIAGPSNGDSYPTVNPSTKLVSVTVKDGVCYVNLDDTFLTQIYNVSADVTIYSIVNSLVELSNVNKVQISINGNSDIVYREKTSLATIFERNLELLK